MCPASEVSGDTMLYPDASARFHPRLQVLGNSGLNAHTIRAAQIMTTASSPCRTGLRSVIVRPFTTVQRTFFLAALELYRFERHKRPRHGNCPPICRDGRENTVCPAMQRSTCMRSAGEHVLARTACFANIITRQMEVGSDSLTDTCNRAIDHR